MTRRLPAVLTIARSSANDLGEPWPIPDTLEPGDYFIRIWCSVALYADSPSFQIKACPLVAQPRPPEPRIDPSVHPKTITMAIPFKTQHRHRESRQWNCVSTMGTVARDVPHSEFLVGFENKCYDRGAVCADECHAFLYRGSPIIDTGRLGTLVGKEVMHATLSFRHKLPESAPPCSSCLAGAIFYSGTFGDWDAAPTSLQRYDAVPVGSYMRIDVTEMIRNWLREADPAYHGERHGYHVYFRGSNEEFTFNNHRCLSWFDDGSLKIQYRD
jgi:hypothetical protein